MTTAPMELERVVRYPVPHGREEAWRFTPLRRMAGLHETAGAGSPEYGSDSSFVSIVERGDPALSAAAAPTDRVSELAWESYTRAAVVDVPAGMRPESAVQLTVRANAGGGDATAAAADPTDPTDQQQSGIVLVRLGVESQSVVVIDHTGTGAYRADITIDVGDGAVATVALLQRMDRDGTLAGRVTARLGRDARLRCVAVTLGGDLVRLATNVEYTAPGGDAELLGAFFATDGQHQEHRLFVDHSEPDCRSNVTYKGALAGEHTHTVWVGDVLIRASATGTDTYETNRNLVLTKGARADSVPNLEIETGNVVGAGHAAATGRFDDEQLFYLQSRGIPADEARTLVVRGFFADLVRRIGVPEVEDVLMQTIEAELSAAGGNTR